MDKVTITNQNYVFLRLESTIIVGMRERERMRERDRETERDNERERERERESETERERKKEREIVPVTWRRYRTW